jgi:hypothetical protein
MAPSDAAKARQAIAEGDALFVTNQFGQGRYRDTYTCRMEN